MLLEVVNSQYKWDGGDYELIRNFTDENWDHVRVMSVDKQTPNIVYVFPPKNEIMICDLTSNVSRCTGSGVCKF